MKNVFLVTGILVLAVVGMIVAQEQSYIEFSYGNWAVTFKAWLVVLALIVLLSVGKLLIGIILWVTHLPRRWATYCKIQRDNKEHEHQQACANALINLQQAKDLAELNEQWNTVPLRWRRTPEFADTYVGKALQYGDEATAAAVIEWQLNDRWQAKFVHYYGLLQQNIPVRLKEITHWLKQHSHDAGLLLAAGRLSMVAQEWGNAEQYLQQSITQQSTVAAYLELALVQQQLGKVELSLRSYQLARGLQRTLVSS